MRSPRNSKEQQTGVETTSKTAALATATSDSGVIEDRSDRAVVEYWQSSAACAQTGSRETTSTTASSVTAGMTGSGVAELHRTGRAVSDNLGSICGQARSGDGDGTKERCDSDSLTSRRATGKPFQISDGPRLVKSEGQTPVSTDEPFRVSRASSLDQLRLRFQQQKKNAGRFRAELGHLRQKFIDARQELNAERSSRRKLEEWTNFLENQLETFIKSRSLVDKQYVLRHRVQSIR